MLQTYSTFCVVLCHAEDAWPWAMVNVLIRWSEDDTYVAHRYWGPAAFWSQWSGKSRLNGCSLTRHHWQGPDSRRSKSGHGDNVRQKIGSDCSFSVSAVCKINSGYRVAKT